MRSKCPSVLKGAVLALWALAACRSATPAHPPQAAATPPAAARDAQTPALPSQAIRWMRSSAEHRAVFLEVYSAATAQVEREAARLSRGAWAVVLDADETVIDNSLYQLERERAGLPFDGPSWHEWTKRREALPRPWCPTTPTGCCRWVRRSPAGAKPPKTRRERPVWPVV